MRYNGPMFQALLTPRLSRPRLVAALLALMLFAPPTDARAQNIISDFFGGLFGRRQKSPYHRALLAGAAPSTRERPHAPHRAAFHLSRADLLAPRHWRPATRTAKTPHRRPAATGNATSNASADANRGEAPAVEADFFVVVMGDTLGELLADGLEEAFEDIPEIGVLHKSKESSGLVRTDFYDWPKTAQGIANGPRKPDVAVMMLGSNDHQPLEDGAQAVEPFSPRWRELYTARVDAVIRAFKEKNIPLVWVGLPMMKAERFSADMGQINEIYRASAASAGVPFIDIWDIFADDHGQYSAFGPDVNGQIVKLRAADGVHFTSAGARKVAHFVEGEIKRIFDARQQQAPEASAPAAQETGALPATPAAAGAGGSTAGRARPGGGAQPAAATSRDRTDAIANRTARRRPGSRAA